MSTVFVGLGSNLGDRATFLRRAVSCLVRGGMHLQKVSSLYETAPVGPVQHQPAFLNAAAELTTELAIPAALDICQRIERELGRQRRIAQGPRTIDLDLLLMDDAVGRWPGLVLPHPRLAERAFVLQPLVELQPALRDPRDGTPMREHLRRIAPHQQVKRLGPFDGVGDRTGG